MLMGQIGQEENSGTLKIPTKVYLDKRKES
jgi:hypothetical protein